MILALDLSSKCTGWSKFSKDGKLIDKGRIIPDTKLNPLMKIHYLTSKVKELFNSIDELIIEDIFLAGFGNVDALKYLARLSGAIIYAWIIEKYKIPHFYMAVVARSLVGIKGNSHKAEVQLFVLKKFNYANKEHLENYEKLINDLKNRFKNKELSKQQFKYQMEKISKKIDEDTKIGEDIADSIILGLAYCNKND